MNTVTIGAVGVLTYGQPGKLETANPFILYTSVRRAFVIRIAGYEGKQCNTPTNLILDTEHLIKEQQPTFLYCFGYEQPWEAASNKSNGSDFESLGFIYITAPSRQAALAWGGEVAQWFVGSIFCGSEGSDPPPSDWRDGNFAEWIEDEPDAQLVQAASRIPSVGVGEFPPFDVFRSALIA